MSDFLYYLVAFAIVLGVLIVVHEFGHYAVARLCGVKVLRFSVGFGRVLWQRRIGTDGTEWAISVFPLGGYVKMLDEREGEVDPGEAHRAFNRQGVGKRSLIVAAGPGANFVLAILLYWGVFMHGSDELLPLLGEAPVDTPAYAAAIRNGDEVRSVDGLVVKTWNDLRWTLVQKAVDADSATLEVTDSAGNIEIRRLSLVAAREQGWEGDALERLGLRFYRPIMPAVVGKVLGDSAGARAGMQPGDRIVAVDGKDIAAWHEFVGIVRESADRMLRLDVERDGAVMALNLQPIALTDGGKTIGRVGVSVADAPELHRPIKTFVRYGLLSAMRRAFSETWDKSIFSVVMMGKMLVGEVSWRNLSGPVAIADYAGQSAKLGLDYYIKFMALVSISLGVLNLMPVPVLDGGHLMYHMLEVVMRRPLSERAMEIGQRIGMSLLFALMAFALFNDLSRLFNG